MAPVPTPLTSLTPVRIGHPPLLAALAPETDEVGEDGNPVARSVDRSIAGDGGTGEPLRLAMVEPDLVSDRMRSTLMDQGAVILTDLLYHGLDRGRGDRWGAAAGVGRPVGRADDELPDAGPSNSTRMPASMLPRRSSPRSGPLIGQRGPLAITGRARPRRWPWWLRDWCR